MSILKNIIEAALVESFTTDEVRRIREKTCSTCDRLDPENLKCLECGCYTDIKAGMDYNKNPKKGFRVEKTHCPLGKWAHFTDGIVHPNDKEIAGHYNGL